MCLFQQTGLSALQKEKLPSEDEKRLKDYFQLFVTLGVPNALRYIFTPQNVK